MAIFLIMDSDRTNSDPKKDKGCYKRGDIVEVFEDDKPCVIPPSPPWLIIKVIGITKAQALKYMDSWLVDSGKVDSLSQPIMNIERRRKFCVKMANLPLSISNTINSSRYIEVNLTQIQNYVFNNQTSQVGL